MADRVSRLSSLADTAADQAASAAQRAAKLARGQRVPSEGLMLGDLVTASVANPPVIDLTDETLVAGGQGVTRQEVDDTLRHWRQLADAEIHR